LKIVIIKPHWQVISLGILAGMRAMAAPAISSHMLNKHPSRRLKHTPFNFMQSDATVKVLDTLAVGELIGDKMPSAPDRIAPAGLVGRCISGAFAGASIYKASGNNWYTGALLGGATAIAATYASFYLRKNLVKHTHIIDRVVGAVEDAIVLGSGWELAQTV
jgi:uncharacterized membrane protein